MLIADTARNTVNANCVLFSDYNLFASIPNNLSSRMAKVLFRRFYSLISLSSDEE